MTAHRLPGASGPDGPRAAFDVEDSAVKAMGVGCLVAAMFAAGAVWMVRAVLGH